MAKKEEKFDVDKEIERLKTTNAKPNEETNSFLRKQGTSEITAGTKLSELLKRTEVTYDSIVPTVPPFIVVETVSFNNLIYEHSKKLFHR